MNRKKVTIIEGEMCVDHVHMLVIITPNVSVSSFVRDMKGRNGLGEKTVKIKAYIQNQLNEDRMTDQYSLKEYYDPFTGSKNK